MDGTTPLKPWAQDRDERGPVGWSSMKGWVQNYLERHGVPAIRAERLSHEIVVCCAREVEITAAEGMRERVQAEADTRLIGWRAASRPGALPAAA